MNHFSDPGHVVSDSRAELHLCSGYDDAGGFHGWLSFKKTT